MASVCFVAKLFPELHKQCKLLWITIQCPIAAIYHTSHLLFSFNLSSFFYPKDQVKIFSTTLREGFRNKIKKSVEFSILLYSVEFIYFFFSIPVSQIRVVCVATLGGLNTGYQDIHVEKKFEFYQNLGGYQLLFTSKGTQKTQIKNLNSLPQF